MLWSMVTNLSGLYTMGLPQRKTVGANGPDIDHNVGICMDIVAMKFGAYGVGVGVKAVQLDVVKAIVHSMALIANSTPAKDISCASVCKMHHGQHNFSRSIGCGLNGLLSIIYFTHTLE